MTERDPRPRVAQHPADRPTVELLVLVPTRNRAGLAAGAVDSALQDAEPDVRIVVSDNSTSESESRELAAACSGRGVRIMRPPSPLAMGAHWDWAMRRLLDESGWTHLVVLTDRFLFVPGALTRLRSLAAAHPDDMIAFEIDRVDDTKSPVELVQHSWTGRLLRVRSDSLLEASSRCAFPAPLPRLLNCLVPRSTIERVLARFGDVCEAVSPDLRFAFRSLCVADSMLVTDRALVLQRALVRSNGHSYSRGVLSPDAKAFGADLDRDGVVFETPLPRARTVVNACAHEYCCVRRESGGGALVPLDARLLLATVRREVNAMQPSARRDDLLGQIDAAERTASGPGAPEDRRPAGLRRVREYLVEAAAGHRPGLVATRIHRIAVRVLASCAPRRVPCPDEEAAIRLAHTSVRPRRRGRSPIEVMLPGTTRVAES